MLADVMPLGLGKPSLCLNTAPSSESLLGGDTSSPGVSSCRCLRSSGELGAGGTCRSLHLRCPELQKEPPAEECCGSELCFSTEGPVGCALWAWEEFLDITELVPLEQCPAVLNVPEFLQTW